MKQFAKSLVSVVIALSILATMCIVGISAVAAETDTNTNKAGLTIVSANTTKQLSDVSKAVDPGSRNTGTLSVVKSNTLTGGDTGVPSEDAYLIKDASLKEGIAMKVLNTDWSGLAGNADAYKQWSLHVWIYIEDADTMNNLVFRFYTDDGSRGTGIGNSKAAVTSQHHRGIALKDGWNNLVFPLVGKPSVTKITEMTVHDHKNDANYNNAAGVDTDTIKYDNDIAIACARLIPNKGLATKDSSWGADYYEAKDFADFTADTKVLTDYTGTRTDKLEKLSLVNVADLKKGNVAYDGPSTNAVKVDLSALSTDNSVGRKGGVYGSLAKPVALDDSANLADYVLDMWIYFEGPETAKGSHVLIFQLYANGYEKIAAGNNNTEFWSARYVFENDKSLDNGWNHVVLSLDKVSRAKDNQYNSAGYLEWSSARTLTGFSFHENAAANNTKYTYAVADITVCHKDYADEANKKPVVYPTDKEYLVYGINGEEGITGTYGAETYEGGTGAFATVVPAGKSYHAFMKNMSTPIDLTGKTVTAWVYVTDATKYDGQLEITSGGGADQQEYNWAAADLGIKNGWNKLVLDPNNKKGTAGVVKGAVGYAGVTAGGLDVTKANFFRIYDTGDLAGIKVGAVYVTPDEKDKVDANREYVDFAPEDKKVEDMNSTMGGEKFEVVKVSTLKKGAAYKGKKTTAYLIDNSGATGAARKAGVYFTLDTPIKMAAKGHEADYTLDMWYYYDGTSSTNILQLYSNNHEANKEGFANTTEYWTYRYILKNLVQGWNHVVVTLDQFSKGADNKYNQQGSADWEANQTITGVSFHENDAANYGKYTYAIADLVVAKTSELVKTGDAVNVAMVVVAILLAAMAASVTVYFGKKAR